MTSSVRPSDPSQTGDGTNLPTDPLKKPTSGGFPGSDLLYSATGAVTSTVSSFVAHVLNGAQLVVRTTAYILFYPFLTHYEARITPEMLSDIIKGIQDGTDSSKKFLELEANVRLAVRNKGDTSSAKKIIEAFAEAEKDVFAKIAQKVIKVKGTDMSQITLAPEAYVLGGIQNGLISVTDFYYALNFYRMETVTPEEQLIVLKFHIEFAEWYQAEVPHAQKLLLAFAEVNVEGFKELVACLAELNEAIKGTDGKSIEEVAKEWIEDSSKFSATQVREALDLKTVKTLFTQVKAEDPFDQAHMLHDYFGRIFLPKKYDVPGLSNARRDFITKAFLLKLGSVDRQLVNTLSMLMIEVDEKNKEEGKDSGLYVAASKDAKYGKPDFDATSHVLTWIKEEKKFDRNVMFNAIQHLEGNVLKEGVTNEKQTPSFRLDIFDRGLARTRESGLGAFIAGFVKAACNKELGVAFVKALIDFDAAKASKSGVERFFPELSEDASDSERLEAVLKVAEEVVKKEDSVTTVFRGNLREAVAHMQKDQFEADIRSKDLDFSQKLDTFLLLSRFTFEDPTFRCGMVVALSETSEDAFADLAIYMAETSTATKSKPRVMELDRLAKLHEAHPDVIAQTRQREHAQRFAITRAFVNPPAELTASEKMQGKQAAYRAVFAAHFGVESTRYQKADLDWLCEGMRSYLNK